MSNRRRSQREDRAAQRGRKNEGEDGDCLIGKWIGDKTSQLGAKIRIPSVLNEIFKYVLASGGLLLKGWMWRICETMTGGGVAEGVTRTVVCRDPEVCLPLH